MPKKLRKQSPVLKEIMEKYNANPIVANLGEEPKLELTEKEHINELQKILVQAVIDYSEKNGLKDMYSVSFMFDDIQSSVEYGEWHPASDSHIKVDGVTYFNLRRKNGEVFKMPHTYTIGESY